MLYRVVRSNYNPDHLEHSESKNHKYIKREMVNGKWRYYYNIPKANKSNKSSSSVPKEYQPDMKESTFGSKKGYTYDGLFYEGDYETARSKAYQRDLDKAQKKMNDQKKEQSYRSSIKRHIDDVIKDISKGTKKLADTAGDTVDRGKNTLDNFFKKFK